MVAGGGVEGAAVCVRVCGCLRAWVGGAGAVEFGDLRGIADELAGGGEGLGVKLISDGFAAGGVDGRVVGDGLLELGGFGDAAELGE